MKCVMFKFSTVANFSGALFRSVDLFDEAVYPKERKDFVEVKTIGRNKFNYQVASFKYVTPRI